MNSIKAFLKGDTTIWVVMILLGLVSILIVYSATANLAYHNKQDTIMYLFKQFFLVVTGLFVMYLVHRIDYNVYARFIKVIFYASLLLVIATYFIGVRVNDAARWIRLPGLGLTIQPSELAKIALFIYLSHILSIKQNVIKDFKQAYRPLIIPIILTCALIAPSNLSTALMIGGVSLIILFVGRVRLKHLMLTILAACIPLVLLVLVTVVAHKNPDIDQKISHIARVGTWMSRIENFIYSETDMYDQAKQANIAIAKGGIFGNGPGHSEQKNFLPNPFSDYIFSIFIEEYGLLSALLLIFMYLVFMFRAISIFKKFKYSFGGFLVISISTGFVLQALLSMMVNVGYFPVTGVSLPLLSMGGTSYLLNSFAIGIILGVARKMDDPKGLATADFIENKETETEHSNFPEEIVITKSMQQI